MAATQVDLFHFDGETVIPKFDDRRLARQLRAVYDLMCDGEWRTLAEISFAVKAPEASVSARLRDLRKERFGSNEVERRHRGSPASGLFEYRLSFAGGRP